MNGRPCLDTGLLTSITLFAVIAMTVGCASNNEKSNEMEDHFAAIEAQQLKELESAEEARKLALRRPPKTANKYEQQEDERNQRYENALAAAERRREYETDTEAVQPEPAMQTSDSDKIWQAGKGAHPVSGKPVCTIRSALSSVDNGGLETQVHIIVTADSVFLRTDATLDNEAEQSAVQIDDRDPFLFEIYANDVTAMIKDQYRTLLIQMALGDSLTASFRYKPHRADTENHTLRLEMTGFAGLLDGLNNC